MPKHKLYHPNGAIFWEGNSRINGKPIIAIVTGLFYPSHNPKTGVMHQSWILARDIHPFEAVQTGQDISICGDCPLRLNSETGKRLCYVNIITPSQIYRSYRNGKYKPVTVAVHHDIWFDLKPLRIGAYGDPTAIPVKVWLDWLDLLKALKMPWTGYTRRWMLPENQEFRSFLMASVFSDAERVQAQLLGWRTYQVIPTGTVLPADAIVCPGSAAGAYAKTCRECSMCRGAAAKNTIVIEVHGNHSKFFKEID